MEFTLSSVFNLSSNSSDSFIFSFDRTVNFKLATVLS